MPGPGTPRPCARPRARAGGACGGQGAGRAAWTRPGVAASSASCPRIPEPSRILHLCLWLLPTSASRHLGLPSPPPPRPLWLCLGGALRGPVARRPPARLDLAGRRACPCCPRRSSAACSISRW